MNNKQRIHWEYVPIALISALFAVLNSWQVISPWLTHSADRVFAGIAHYSADYFLYVTQMAQGSFWYRHSFTNEPVLPTWIYWFNGLVGRLGKLLALSPWATYNLSLFLLVIVLVLLWYVLVCKIYPASRGKRLISLFFILTASNFTFQGELLGEFWFSPTPAFNRLGGVPHQVWQTILLILLTMVYAKILKYSLVSSQSPPVVGKLFRPSLITYYLLLIALSFLSAIANPIQMLLLTVAGAATAAWAVINKKTTAGGAIAPFVALASAAWLGAWLTNREFDNQTIFTVGKVWEATQQVAVTLPQFILAVGPISLLIPFGLPRFLKRATPLSILVFIYGALSIALFFSPLPAILATARSRWIHPTPYALLPILATEGIISVSRWFSNVLSKIAKDQGKLFVIGLPHEALAKWGHLSLIALYCLLTLPSLSAQIDARANPQKNTVIASDLNHIPQPVVAALTRLATLPEDNQPVVVVAPQLPYDVLVPVFSGKISFTGHPVHTLYPEVKEALRRRFFAGQMTAAEARQFLTDHRIGYVLTPNPPIFLKDYPFLKQVFANATLIIYVFSPN